MHLVKTILTAGLLLSAAAQAHNVLEFPQPENNPEEFYAVTEIPTGGIIKYETDAKTGFIVADRFQSMPVAYPANYGSLTQSLAGDGDPLDVVFYTRAPMAPGTLIKLRAIGVLKMIDGGEKDDKIIAGGLSRSLRQGGYALINSSRPFATFDLAPDAVAPVPLSVEGVS